MLFFYLYFFLEDGRNDFNTIKKTTKQKTNLSNNLIWGSTSTKHCTKIMLQKNMFTNLLILITYYNIKKIYVRCQTMICYIILLSKPSPDII